MELWLSIHFRFAYFPAAFVVNPVHVGRERELRPSSLKHLIDFFPGKGRLVLQPKDRNHVNRAKTPCMMAVRLAAAAFPRETLSQASGVNYLYPEIVEEIFGKYFVLVSPNTCMI